MKIIVLTLCVLFIGCATTIHNEPGYDYGKGTGNIGTANGRLIFELADSRIVELIGIKVPSPGSPHYILTLNYVSRLVKRRRVKLIFDAQKENGNTVLAYVYVWLQYSGDVFLNADMVRKGYAYAESTPPNTKHDDRFAELEATAKDEKRVIWKTTDALF